MRQTTHIVVSLQYEATHQWAGCNIKEVDFLKHPHRHMFHISCTLPVHHDDRSVEIIQFKRKVLNYLAKYDGDFEWRSCEMIAKELCEVFNLSSCKVLEDGENGALVTQE